jgi:Domain of unknown function (DUF4386)
MAEHREEAVNANPMITARIAGAFYLATFVIGGVAQFASGGLIAANDARATAGNVLQHEQSFWLGLAAYLMVIASYIAVTGLFYQLFESVNGSLSMIAAFFSLVGYAVQGCACFFYLVPAFLIESRQHSTMFTLEQLQVLAYLGLKLYGQAYSIGFVFFGFYCCLIGYLIFKSTFLPRIVGLMMIFAGLAWLTFLVPPLANSHFPTLLASVWLARGHSRYGFSRKA